MTARRLSIALLSGLTSAALAACTTFAERRIADRVAPASGRPWTSTSSRAYAAPLPSAERADGAGLDLSLLPPELRAFAAGTWPSGQGPSGPVVLTLDQVLAVALAETPTTRVTWAEARAAAAELGSRRGEYFPRIDVTVTGAATHQTVSGGRLTFEQTSLTPAANLTWLLLDLGGRGARVEEAEHLLAAANLAHDAAINDAVLRVEQTYYQYQAAKALVASAEVSLREAEVGLESANERRASGVATIADVLQAQTALSQAKLALTTQRGQVAVARGALATSMGVSPELPVDVAPLPEDLAVEPLGESISRFLAEAERQRPDLAEARARALAAASAVGSARSAGLPTLTVNGNIGRSYYYHAASTYGDTYGANLVLGFPLFTGLQDTYDRVRAEEQERSARARAEVLGQQVVYEVWSSYHGVRTAAEQVAAARDLLASARQSRDVALGRYREGVGTIIDLLNAEAALASARAQEVQARAGWLTAVANLAHDTGRLQHTRPEAPPAGKP